MTATRFVIVAVCATFAALFLAWWTAPDHGPDVVAHGPPPPTTVASAPPPAGPPARPGAEPPTSRAIPPLPDRRPAPFPAVERLPANEAHTADQPGLGLAAIERRAELVECWDDHLQSGAGSAGGRFTIKLTLTDGGNDEGVLAVEVPQVPDDPQLHACVNAAFADARFDSPGEVAQAVVWPVPLSPATD